MSDTEHLSAKRISVIIPTKNEDDVIQNCLSSIFQQSVKPFEVIIVDGHSTDDTIKKATQFPVKILFETKPTSLPKARNMGIKTAIGEILLMMDADVILEKNCLENALSYFNNSEIMAIIPSQNVNTHTYLEKIQTKWFFGTLNRIRMGIGRISPVQFFRKEVFNKIKYDPNLGYGEDTDFQDKLRLLSSKSRKIIFAPDIKISVHFPHSLQELKSQYIWYGRTFKKYFIKNHSIKTILNLSSLLMPCGILFLSFFGIFIPELLILSIAGFTLLVIKNIVACYRSKSIFILEFLFFEFLRSIFFFIGIIQGFFNKKTGR